MRVRIAKLGQPVQTVEVADGANVSAALKTGGFDLDSIKSVKKNSTPVELTGSLADGDVLLVSSEKIKGGADEIVDDGVILLDLEVEEVAVSTATEGVVAYDNTMSTWQIVREFLNSNGYSINDFIKVVDMEGNEVTTFETNRKYKVQVEIE